MGLPTLSLVDLLHATGGGFPFLFVAASVGLFICLDFGSCPLFLLECFLLIKFGRVSSSFWSGPGRLVSLKFGDEICRTER